MFLTHKIRLDPTTAQEAYFRKACGVARFAYNWALEAWNFQYEIHKIDPEMPAPNVLSLLREFTALKWTRWPWVGEVTKCAPEYGIKNLCDAFKHFFRRVKSGKKGQKLGYPRFKCKGKRDAFRATNGPQNANSDAVLVEGRTVKLPRIGVIRMREESRFTGRVMSAVVSQSADQWYVSLLVETDQRLESVKDKGAVGVDLGISTLATFSNGETAPAVKPHRAAHKRLVRVSRSLSRKVKGSANRAKAKTKLARLHLRIANIRKDALHKLTTRLVTEYSTVAIEDLNVSGMVRNRRYARSVADSGFGEFRRQLEYKAKMTGTEILVVNRFFPSSKTCSECGVIHDMPLSKRQMICACGNNMCRDLNAARNILRQALASKSVESAALATALAVVKPRSMKQKTVSCAVREPGRVVCCKPVPSTFQGNYIMAKKNAAAETEDLLGGTPEVDDLLGGASKPAKKTAPAKKAAAPAAKKANGSKAAPAAAAPAAKKGNGKAAAAPAAKKVAKPAGERVQTEHGGGKYYMDPDEKIALAKKIATSKKPISTKELAEKYAAPTWQVRRAIAEILVKEGKGTTEKVGSSLVFTPA